MSSSLDVCFTDSDFLLLCSGRERKQPAKILFYNIRHHSWQPWAGFTGQREALFPCQSHGNAIPHTLTSVQPAGGPSEGKRRKEGRTDGRMRGRLWKTSLTARRKTFWVLCHRCQSTADSQLRSSKCVRNKVLKGNTLEHTLALHADGVTERTPSSVSHCWGIFWAASNSTPILLRLLLLLPPFPPSSSLQREHTISETVTSKRKWTDRRLWRLIYSLIYYSSVPTTLFNATFQMKSIH